MSGPGYCFDCGDELDEGESLCDACGESFMSDADEGVNENGDEVCPECGGDDMAYFEGGPICLDCEHEG